jgi:hypothetical protein
LDAERTEEKKTEVLFFSATKQWIKELYFEKNEDLTKMGFLVTGVADSLFATDEDFESDSKKCCNQFNRKS